LHDEGQNEQNRPDCSFEETSPRSAFSTSRLSPSPSPRYCQTLDFATQSCNLDQKSEEKKKLTQFGNEWNGNNKDGAMRINSLGRVRNGWLLDIGFGNVEGEGDLCRNNWCGSNAQFEDHIGTENVDGRPELHRGTAQVRLEIGERSVKFRLVSGATDSLNHRKCGWTITSN
jgi:hypothetical protein